MTALSFPIGATAFFSTLKIRSVRWSLAEFNEDSGTGSGHLIRVEMAPPKWMAEVRMAPMALADARRARAYMRAISSFGSAGTFHLYNPDAQFPAGDPDGSRLQASGGVFVHTLPTTTRRELRLGGLPQFYRLGWGDFFEVRFGQRRALFEVNEDVSANASGTTPFFAITPAWKSGMAAGNVVSLFRPVARMTFLNYDAGVGEMVIADGMSFTAIEVP